MDNVHELPKERCEFCKKREATKLCDKVKGTWSWVGHPPKINGYIDTKEPMDGIITCDNKICDKCATNITGMDACPSCLEEIKKALGVKRK